LLQLSPIWKSHIEININQPIAWQGVKISPGHPND